MVGLKYEDIRYIEVSGSTVAVAVAAVRGSLTYNIEDIPNDMYPTINRCEYADPIGRCLLTRPLQKAAVAVLGRLQPDNTSRILL